MEDYIKHICLFCKSVNKKECNMGICLNPLSNRLVINIINDTCPYWKPYWDQVNDPIE